MPLYCQGLSFPLAQMPRPNGVSRSITGDCGVEQGGIAAGFFQTENAYHCVLGFSPRSETGSMELLLERANPLPVKILAKNTERGRNRAPGLAWSDSVGQQEQASAVTLACACLGALRVPPLSVLRGTGICVTQVSGCLCLGVVRVHVSMALRTPCGCVALLCPAFWRARVFFQNQREGPARWSADKGEFHSLANP